jgi:hypothetical protein
MKNTTKKRNKRLDPIIAEYLRHHRSANAQIAALGQLDHSYVSAVIARKKPPSRKFLLALDCFLAGQEARLMRVKLHSEHPEIEAAGAD